MSSLTTERERSSIIVKIVMNIVVVIAIFFVVFSLLWINQQPSNPCALANNPSYCNFTLRNYQESKIQNLNGETHVYIL